MILLCVETKSLSLNYNYDACMQLTALVKAEVNDGHLLKEAISRRCMQLTALVMAEVNGHLLNEAIWNE